MSAARVEVLVEEPSMEAARNTSRSFQTPRAALREMSQ